MPSGTLHTGDSVAMWQSPSTPGRPVTADAFGTRSAQQLLQAPTTANAALGTVATTIVPPAMAVSRPAGIGARFSPVVSTFRLARSVSPTPVGTPAHGGELTATPGRSTPQVKLVPMPLQSSARSSVLLSSATEVRQVETPSLPYGPQRSLTTRRTASPPPMVEYDMARSPRGGCLLRAASTSAPSIQFQGSVATAVQAAPRHLLDLERPLADLAAQDSREYSPRDSVWKRYFCNSEGALPSTAPSSSPRCPSPPTLTPANLNACAQSYVPSSGSLPSTTNSVMAAAPGSHVVSIGSRPERADHFSPRGSSQTASPTSGLRSALHSARSLQPDRDSQDPSSPAGSMPLTAPSADLESSLCQTAPVVAAEDIAPLVSHAARSTSEGLLKLQQPALRDAATGSSQASTCGGGTAVHTARTDSLADSWPGNSQRLPSPTMPASRNLAQVPIHSQPGDTVVGNERCVPAPEALRIPSPSVAVGASGATVPDLAANTAPTSTAQHLRRLPSPECDQTYCSDAISSTAPPAQASAYEKAAPPPPVRSPKPKVTPNVALLQRVAACAEAVSADDLQALRDIDRPHPTVREVVETCLVVLGYRDTRWSAAQAHLAHVGDFIERLRTLDVWRNVSQLQYQKLCRSLAGQQLSSGECHIHSSCAPCAGLVRWCHAVYELLAPQFGASSRLSSGRQRSRSPEVPPMPQGDGSFSPSVHVSLANAGHQTASASAPSGSRGDYSANSSEEEKKVRVRPDLGCLQIFPDIYAMSSSELQHVCNLTIGKADVGEVTFPCEIDMLREYSILEDLPNIIRLDPGEVVLYPDSGTKPKVGEGLNRPAIITLFQCMPPNNGAFPDADSKARYRERIARMTEQKGARFVDYDCDRGIWRFRVDHF